MSAKVTAHGDVAPMRNATVIDAAATLYIKDGMKVADVTYGHGTFWKGVIQSRFILLKSDIEPRTADIAKEDYRDLSYETASLDVIVFDPPYIHNPGKHVGDPRYNNAATMAGKYHDDIKREYFAGMAEAHRVLKLGGQLWVKCKD